jgi:hypothetical protein
MSAVSKSVWLGYTKTGMKFKVGYEDLLPAGAILGHGANDLAALFAFCANEAGLRTLVVDLNGSVAEKLSGYIPAFGASYILQDALTMNDDDMVHGQLIASAYATIFNLPATQEGILNLALKQIVSEGNGSASPAALGGSIGTVTGFRATDKEELEGRMSTLSLMEATGNPGAVTEVLGQSSIVDFSQALTLELGNASAAIFLAKTLALVRKREVPKPDLVVISDAYRIYRAYKVSTHSRTLTDALLTSSMVKVFASEIGAALDEQLVGASPVRILSSAVWNELSEKGGVLPGTFVLRNAAFDSQVPFLPRLVEGRSGEKKLGPEPLPTPKELTRLVLEMVANSSMATRSSLVDFLSEYDRATVGREIDRLCEEDFLRVMRPQREEGGPSAVLVLSAVGQLELEKMSKDGETADPV